MDNELERLAYDSSLRSLDKQEQVLNELRARTGLLLAASSLSATFLGRPALEDAETAFVVLGLVSFGLSIGASVYVLLPRNDLVFSLVGSAVYEQLFALRTEMNEVYRRLAYDLDRFWEANDATMVTLFRAFRIAAIALAAEIALLLASVAGTLF
jgi:hypothetical protein